MAWYAASLDHAIGPEPNYPSRPFVLMTDPNRTHHGARAVLTDQNRHGTAQCAASPDCPELTQWGELALPEALNETVRHAQTRTAWCEDIAIRLEPDLPSRLNPQGTVREPCHPPQTGPFVHLK